METKKLLKSLKRRLGLITAILAMLAVSQGMYAATTTYYYRGSDNSWGATEMTASSDGYYCYKSSSSNANQFKIAKSTSGWDYNCSKVSKNFNRTDVDKIGDYGGDNCYCWQSGTYYIILYYPNTNVNSSSDPKICAATKLPDDFNVSVKSDMPVGSKGTVYVGSKISKGSSDGWWYNYQVGLDKWNSSKVFIGTTQASADAISASQYGEEGSNRKLHADLDGYQFKSAGTYYAWGGVQVDSKAKYACTTGTGWTTSTTPTLNASSQIYWTVNAVPKPSACVATVTNAVSGTGTQADPYIVRPNASYTVKLTATTADASLTGYGWNINSSSSKASSSTTNTYTKAYTADAAGSSAEYTGYAWHYNGSTTYYSSEYATSSKIYVSVQAACPTPSLTSVTGNNSVYAGSQQTYTATGASAGESSTIKQYNWTLPDGWSATSTTTTTNSITVTVGQTTGSGKTVSCTVTNQCGNTSAAKSISVTVNPVTYTWYLVGLGGSDVQLTGSNNELSCSKTLAAETHYNGSTGTTAGFKVKSVSSLGDEVFYGFNGDYNPEDHTKNLSSGADYAGIKKTGPAGSYTFNFNTSNKSLEIVYPTSYYLKHNFGNGSDWTWEWLNTDNGDGTYSRTDVYGGNGCNWLHLPSGDKDYIGSPTLMYEPSAGDECVFTYKPSDHSLTIAKVGGCTPPVMQEKPTRVAASQSETSLSYKVWAETIGDCEVSSWGLKVYSNAGCTAEAATVNRTDALPGTSNKQELQATGLNANTKYWAKSFANHSGGTSWNTSDPTEWATKVALGTTSSTVNDCQSATLSSSSELGGSAVTALTSANFRYSTNQSEVSDGTGGTVVSSGVTTVGTDFSKQITGLTPNTTYYYRAEIEYYNTGAGGANIFTYSDVKSFKTNPISITPDVNSITFATHVVLGQEGDRKQVNYTFCGHNFTTSDFALTGTNATDFAIDQQTVGSGTAYVKIRFTPKSGIGAKSANLVVKEGGNVISTIPVSATADCITPTKANYDVSGNEHIYDGTAKTAVITPNPGDYGTFTTGTAKYDGQTSQTNVGEYTILYNVPAGGNYCATEFDFDAKLTINKATFPDIAGLPTETVILCSGLTEQLTPVCAGATFTYLSNATGVATVSESGLITAVAAGDATITVTATNPNYNDKSATVTVQVKTTPSVTITASPESVGPWEISSITVTPSAGTAAVELWKGGSEVSPTDADVVFEGSGTAYKLKAANKTASPITYTVKAIATLEGCTGAEATKDIPVTKAATEVCQ